MNKKSIYKTKRIRYGLSAAAIAAGVIAFVIIFNVIFSSLSTKYLWQLDMTSSQVFSLSDEAKNILESVNGNKNEEKSVKIYFAQEPDRLMDGSSSSAYMKYVYQTALQMQEACDYITVECIDVVKNPNAFKRFVTTEVSNIYTTNVVVESGEQSRILSYEAFFMFDEDYTSIWAYNGEKKFVSTILQVTSTALPVAYFTTSHGEVVGEDAAALRTLVADAGFEVRDIDLTKEDIDKSARLVVINNPAYDFAGFDEEVNEIAKIDAFLDDYGSLLVFADAQYSANLKNLSELISEWGIGFTPDTVIRDSANSVSVDGQSIVTKYASETMGASLYLDISALDTQPKTICRSAMPLQLLWGEGKSGGDLGSPRTASAVLSCYDTAEHIKDGAAVSTGEAPVMTVSREKHLVQDSEYYASETGSQSGAQYNKSDSYYNYVVVCSSPSFAEQSYIQSSVYGNNDILYSTVRLTTREQIVANIKFKPFDSTALSNTTAQANRWTVALTLAFPVIAAVAGTVVWVRRKNS